MCLSYYICLIVWSLWGESSSGYVTEDDLAAALAGLEGKIVDMIAWHREVKSERSTSPDSPLVVGGH